MCEKITEPTVAHLTPAVHMWTSTNGIEFHKRKTITDDRRNLTFDKCYHIYLIYHLLNLNRLT